ncbi:A-kinase-interacting protein 1 [Latimeria chalumnae]|uniref:A-kinase interacting protein 1 n=1 Tax=Latimeria chalumnae TaxID=7897 RepID=M3XGT1_LATCH|nr:PREDICTED: A-kinase-interacting protein 1 [Latimeria chalumnae]XP_005989730.1 PREDICTED: A-kinase-interacting protein 1 [Latimeria chalumnae]XP_014340325.1 PREDICTED: A-kinase-interacting protein 1 [Latimeria chalumnae]|eukprot:XP_005989729.1 PREDICTED: A-kinase-interacting protein 1 [Latimeria chalumnae]
MAFKSTWIEYSLGRSAKLGLEVFERAQRRNVEWPTYHPSPEIKATGAKWDKRQQDQSLDTEVEARCINLDDAFAGVLKSMAETTGHCKKYYSGVPACECSKQEENHICKYHIQKSQQILLKSAISKKTTKRTLEDIHIDVAPGAYTVIAGSPDSEKLTQVVHINPGQSVDITFSI